MNRLAGRLDSGPLGSDKGSFSSSPPGPPAPGESDYAGDRTDALSPETYGQLNAMLEQCAGDESCRDALLRQAGLNSRRYERIRELCARKIDADPDFARRYFEAFSRARS